MDPTRRKALGLLGMLTVLSAARGQVIPVEIVTLSDAGQIGWYKPFEFHGRPCLVVRTAQPHKDGLQVGKVFLLAYVLECTHAGCRLSLPGGGTRLSCPCHGSQFELQSGRNVAGPARDPLIKVRLELRENRMWAVGFVD